MEYVIWNMETEKLLWKVSAPQNEIFVIPVSGEKLFFPNTNLISESPNEWNPFVLQIPIEI